MLVDPSRSIASRVAALDWQTLAADLDERGSAVTSELLTRRDCDNLIGLYAEEALFRVNRH